MTAYAHMICEVSRALLALWLVGQCGSDEFAAREQASSHLAALCSQSQAAYLTTLCAGVLSQQDHETALRCRRLIERVMPPAPRWAKVRPTPKGPEAHMVFPKRSTLYDVVIDAVGKDKDPAAEVGLPLYEYTFDVLEAGPRSDLTPGMIRRDPVLRLAKDRVDRMTCPIYANALLRAGRTEGEVRGWLDEALRREAGARPGVPPGGRR